MQNSKSNIVASGAATRPYMPDFAQRQDNLDLREFWRTLTRQKGLILAVLVIVLLLTLLFTLLSSPVYRATARVQVERETTKVIDVDFINPGDIRDTRDFYQTQFELIRSFGLVERVIDKLQLDDSIIRRSLPARLRDTILPDDTRDQKASLANAIIENLTIEPIKNSRLVEVHFDGSSPEGSARVANAIVDTFIELNLERRFETTQNAQDFLTDRIKDAKTKLQEAEANLNRYAEENDIIMLDDKDSTAGTHAIMRLSEEVVKAESEVIALKSDPRSSRAELEAAQKKAELVRDELGREQARAQQLQSQTVTYKTLQREVETNQALYQGLLQRMKEINVAGGVGTNNIMLVDQAQVPLKKYKPKLSTNLGFASLLGLFLGIAAAFLREYMDDSVKNVNDLERQTQLDVIGIIPASKIREDKKIAQLALSEPHSSIAEAFRTLRTTLRFKLRRREGSANIIFITSAKANEGKTTVSVNLASTYAHAGNRVLLIDADLRNPSMHKLLGVKNTQGLTNYLSGRLAQDKLIQSANVQNLDVIAAGETAHDPAELLANRRMEDLLKAATEHYDIVILDGPPVLGLADSLILASLSTLTILAIHTGNTSMTTINNALKRLRQSGISVNGLLLNQVTNAERIGYENDYYQYPVARG
ncbi:MAG TPA: polysaccharide biosynthesis tyrosine autokinase [Thiolinea sp.]|nr:polysaccharide biosynthesis tyrosine autokinase [Thiolinea sp.]